MKKVKADILPNYFLDEKGIFRLSEALDLSGKTAGVCYDPEGLDHLMKESCEKTNRRINNTLCNGHHSVYDHISISFYLQNLPKMLAMILNNEKQYTTSEKSLRYTPIDANSDISLEEEKIYQKWLVLLEREIKKQ